MLLYHYSSMKHNLMFLIVEYYSVIGSERVSKMSSRLDDGVRNRLQDSNKSFGQILATKIKRMQNINRIFIIYSL